MARGGLGGAAIHGSLHQLRQSRMFDRRRFRTFRGGWVTWPGDCLRVSGSQAVDRWDVSRSVGCRCILVGVSGDEHGGFSVSRLTDQHFAGLLGVRSAISVFERPGEREARSAGPLGRRGLPRRLHRPKPPPSRRDGRRVSGVARVACPQGLRGVGGFLTGRETMPQAAQNARAEGIASCKVPV